MKQGDTVWFKVVPLHSEGTVRAEVLEVSDCGELLDLLVPWGGNLIPTLGARRSPGENGHAAGTWKPEQSN